MLRLREEILSIRLIDVVFRWQDVSGDVSDLAVLVVDVLRATTTMATILHQGGEAVLPIEDLSQAYKYKERDASLILGGERNNVAPSGFDGGNSPFDYSRELVGGRRVVFTTTNGTQALGQARKAKWVGCASLLNARASAEAQQNVAGNGLIICAGTQGQTSLDDVLAAGAVVSYWPRECWSDGAYMAYLVFERYRDRLYDGLADSRHGRRLLEMGLERDLKWASQLNHISSVPVRQLSGWFS